MTTLSIPRRSEIRGAVLVGGTGLAALVAGKMVTQPPRARMLLAVALVGLFSVLALRTPRAVMFAVIVWLALLGTLRRIWAIDYTGSLGDVLLLVAPLVWAALGLVAVHYGALRSRTRLTTAFLALAGLLSLSTLNPLQGGLTVGLAGAVLTVGPMMAFLVGRALVDDATMRRILLLLIGLAILAASYGLWQTFVRFPTWDQTWIIERGYMALNVGGVIRAFASFSAASEYGIFLGVGIICTAAFARRPSRSVLALAVIALLATGLWFESSRGIVVLAIASLAVMVAARRGWRGPKAATITILALVALPFAIGHLAPARFGSDAGGALAAHQVQGLADPFGSQSTLPGHFGEMMRGITGAIKQPMGVGVGSVTNAAAKFGGTSGGTEVDIGNVGVAAGLPGLLAFLAVAGFGLTRLYRLAASRRDAIAVAALGVAVVMGLQWLTSGNYAVIFLPWLVLGWADRAEAGPGQPEPS